LRRPALPPVRRGAAGPRQPALPRPAPGARGGVPHLRRRRLRRRPRAQPPGLPRRGVHPADAALPRERVRRRGRPRRRRARRRLRLLPAGLHAPALPRERRLLARRVRGGRGHGRGRGRLHPAPPRGPLRERGPRRAEVPAAALPSYADSTVTQAIDPSLAAGPLKRVLLGSGYREAWTTPVAFPVLDLSMRGGLTPVKRGGGMQTVSLRLEDAEGQ